VEPRHAHVVSIMEMRGHFFIENEEVGV